MWLILYNKITTKHYNKVKRTCQKVGFYPKTKTPPILYIKSFLEHILLKKSWRAISESKSMTHASLFGFYNKYKDNKDIHEIFHNFCKDGIIVYIEENSRFHREQIQNNHTQYLLTYNRLKSILEKY